MDSSSMRWVGAIAMLASFTVCQAAFIPENQPRFATITVHVVPQGPGNGDGSKERPFTSLAQAQKAVRDTNSRANVVVELGDGLYRLTEPLAFRVADGGQDGTTVTWRAAEHAHPVIAGSIAVTVWSVYDKRKAIYVARIPAGRDARQIWVNDQLSAPGEIELPRGSVSFTRDGMVIDDPQYNYLARLAAPDRMEVHSTGWFTNRFSPVAKIVGHTLYMQQPAWDNNTWGYDALHAPVGAETAHLFLSNSLDFLRREGQFYIDPEAGRLYYRSKAGGAMEHARVELPVLPYLVSIAGTLEQPIRDLTFRGIRFAYTSWMGPSSKEGYADQQSGAFIAGVSTSRPRDAWICVAGVVGNSRRDATSGRRCRPRCRSRRRSESYSISPPSHILDRLLWALATMTRPMRAESDSERAWWRSNAVSSRTWPEARSWPAVSREMLIIPLTHAWRTGPSSSAIIVSSR